MAGAHSPDLAGAHRRDVRRGRCSIGRLRGRWACCCRLASVAARVVRSPGPRPMRGRSRLRTPGTTWTCHTTGSKPRRPTVSVVVAGVARRQRPGSAIEPGHPRVAHLHAIRASGIGVLSAAWATALNGGPSASGTCIGSAHRLGRDHQPLWQPVHEQRRTALLAEAAHDDFRATRRPRRHDARRVHRGDGGVGRVPLHAAPNAAVALRGDTHAQGFRVLRAPRPRSRRRARCPPIRPRRAAWP